jgi:hypothetical protein
MDMDREERERQQGQDDGRRGEPPRNKKDRAYMEGYEEGRTIRADSFAALEAHVSSRSKKTLGEQDD